MTTFDPKRTLPHDGFGPICAALETLVAALMGVCPRTTSKPHLSADNRKLYLHCKQKSSQSSAALGHTKQAMRKSTGSGDKGF